MSKESTPDKSRFIALEGGYNFRDLGGIIALDGRRIRKGVLFRSAMLGNLTNADLCHIEQLGIKTVLDYRDDREVGRVPDKLWPGATYIHEPTRVFVSPKEDGAEKERPSGNLVALYEQLKSGALDGVSAMHRLYAGLPFNNSGYKALFSLLYDENRLGLVQHCTAGKDRAGVGSALVLFALGIPMQSIIEDYLASKEGLRHFWPVYLHKAGVEAARHQKVFAPLREVRLEYLQSMIDAVTSAYGSFDSYFEGEFGLSAHALDTLRNIYLE